MGLFLLYCTPACVSKGRNERFHWINGVVATQLMTSALSTGCCTGRPRDARTWFTMSRMIITDKVRVRDRIRRPRLLGYLCTLKQQVCELNRCSVGSLDICWNVLQFPLFIFLNWSSECYEFSFLFSFFFNFHVINRHKHLILDQTCVYVHLSLLYPKLCVVFIFIFKRAKA